MSTATLNPRERLAAALAIQDLQKQTGAMLAPAPCPLHERPAGEVARRPNGELTVKPFEKLIGPAQELVLTGDTLATAPLTTRPLTRAELTSEKKSLEREARIIDERLRQVRRELNTLPIAA